MTMRANPHQNCYHRQHSSAEIVSTAVACHLTSARAWLVMCGRYVETLYGHQEAISALDALAEQTLLSAGEDRTVRLWKVPRGTSPFTSRWHLSARRPVAACRHCRWLGAALQVADETQMLFANGHSAPVDCAALLHAEGFVSGSQDGSLALWSAKRKRPLSRVNLAHGTAPWGGVLPRLWFQVSCTCLAC